MRVLHISHSDKQGGAAIGAYNLHRAMLSYGIQSEMWVRVKITNDPTVICYNNFFRQVLTRFSSKCVKLQKTDNSVIHSIDCVSSNFSFLINESNFNIVNLHWVGSEAMSVTDISRINKPVVWTMRDMWPFCGAEHYAGDDSNARWRIGYTSQNRSANDSGLDIDRWVWERKRKAWKNPMHLVALSSWLAKCSEGSRLMGSWPTSVIPNVIDVNKFKPHDKNFCRRKFNFPLNKKIILFGALGGAEDERKGQRHLVDALKIISSLVGGGQLMGVVFGQSEPKQPLDIPLPIRWMGQINDELTLAELYSAADVMVVPSLQESFGKTAAEPQACGCPVVAFGATGLMDIIEHQVTGYLAKPYSAEDLADGIGWVIDNEDRRKELSLSARNRAIKLWSCESVIPQYFELYKKLSNHVEV